MNFLVRSCCREISKRGIFFNNSSSVFEIGLSRANKFTWLSNSAVLKTVNQSGGLLDKFQFYASSFIFDFRLKLNKVMKRVFLIEKEELAKKGFLWYATLDKVNTVDFIKLFEMQDSFYSWYKITALHVWIILVRLNQDAKGSRVVKNALIEAMWTDVSYRAKNFAPLNKSYKKNLINFNDQFKTLLFAYDEGFLMDDKVLCNALWCHFFDKNCENPRKLEALVSYVRHQVKHLEKFNIEDVNDGALMNQVWMPLAPHFSELKM